MINAWRRDFPTLHSEHIEHQILPGYWIVLLAEKTYYPEKGDLMRQIKPAFLPLILSGVLSLRELADEGIPRPS